MLNINLLDRFSSNKNNKKRRVSKKETLKKGLLYNFGEQDQVDLLSYSGLEESSSYLQMGEKFVRTLFISGYPYTASTGWLNMLINFNHNIDITYHIEQVDPIAALPKLNRKITELESTKRTMLKAGKVIGSEITDPLESAMELKDKIQRGQEKLFQVSIYMTITADSLIELNKKTTLLETVMSTRLFYIKTAAFQQLEGLQSVLPRAQNVLAQKRNLDSSSAALTFPFVSSELVQESGILYGINKSNSSLVIVDRFSLNNANSIVFAQSGSGKSYTAKVEILRQLMQGTKVIVIDPEREYKQLAASVNGTYIRLSAKSKEKINPFDFSLNSSTGDELAEQIQDLTEIVSLMAGGLSAEEKGAVDKAILQTYKDHGWQLVPNNVSKKKKNKDPRGRKPKEKTYPVLKDFYKVLKGMNQKKLCARLEKFIKGSLSSVFDSQTNIKMDNRLVIFDIKDLNESIRQIMMLVVANFVNSQVKSNPQRRILVIDEGWMLLQHEESARFIAGLTRRARKYYLGVTIISQQANDFLSQDYGRAIASQSALRILMKQDTTTIKKVASEFNLSEYEQNFLLTCDRGEALIIADQNHVALKVVASEKEHPLLTTDPREIYI
ncbi:MAG: Type IV secretory pathway VirB4 component-like protein [Candidatus Daviesbacteria bacterium GW2011_GWA2_39_33]|nr:MAG: Type IV secretory pathway VirB4 component-like protein [Candidatus Daviesbacteria bacterium GW2011_GWA2_39_33]